jgi:hypothetical protein
MNRPGTTSQSQDAGELEPLTDEELGAEDIAPLPERDAMSVISFGMYPGHPLPPEGTGPEPNVEIPPPRD